MDASAAYVDTSLRNIRGHMRQGSVCGGASFELGRRDDDADQLARVVGHLHELEAEERCFVWPGFISHSATLLPKSLYTAGPACMMARTEPSSTSCSRAGTSVNRLGRSLCSRAVALPLAVASSSAAPDSCAGTRAPPPRSPRASKCVWRPRPDCCPPALTKDPPDRRQSSRSCCPCRARAMLVLLAHSGRRAIAVAHEVAPAAPAKLAACRDLYDVEGLVGLGEALPQLVDQRLRQLRLEQRDVVRLEPCLACCTRASSCTR